MRSVSLIAIAALLTGCTAQSYLHGVAVNHNELVADTTDELTLLNIIRAKERFPMHFTSLQSLRGSATISGDLRLGASIPTAGSRTVTTGNSENGGVPASSRTEAVGRAVGTLSPSIGVSASSTPSFELAVLNTEKFQRGILQPISPALVGYYLDQGFPESLIAALFIERITFSVAERSNPSKTSSDIRLSAGEILAVLDNDPASGGTCFRSYFDQHRLEAHLAPRAPLPLFSLNSVLAQSSLEEAAVLNGEDFDLAPSETPAAGATTNEGAETMVVRMRSSVPTFRIVRGRRHPGSGSQAAYDTCLNEEITERVGPLLAPVDSQTVSYSLTSPSDHGYRVEIASETDETNGKSQLTLIVSRRNRRGEPEQISIPIKAQITLRSAQGMHYFLGEVARAGSTYSVVDDDDGEARRLFVLHENSSDGAITTRFNGIDYSIPYYNAEPINRSLQVVDILQQILNIHRSAEELPRTQTVTVVP